MTEERDALPGCVAADHQLADAWTRGASDALQQKG